MAGTDTSKTAPLPPGPAVILVEPQMGENIGAAARAMLNCGLTDLRIVRPRDGWPSQKAASASAGADSVIDAARVYPTTADAIADLQFVLATTARRRGMVKPILTPTRAAETMRAEMAAGNGVGILFGRERSGLANHDVMRAQAIITAPLNPAYSSLNLGQSVLLVAWEWLKSGDETPAEELPTGKADFALQGSVDALMNHLDDELDAAQFYRTSFQRPAMQQNLRNIFARAKITEQEVRTLRGVVARMAAFRRRFSK